jgi:regulatory protein
VFNTTEDMRTAATVVKSLSLEVGAEFESMRDLRGQVDVAELEQARERALRILNVRDKTDFEMRKRLSQDGYGKKTVDAVVDRLVEVGLIDDARYTELFISNAQVARKGWRRVCRELQMKGIDIDTLEPPDSEEELMRAHALIARLPVETYKEQQRALRRLITKGYDFALARKVIEMKSGDVLY